MGHQLKNTLDKFKISLMVMTTDYFEVNEFYGNATNYLNGGAKGIHQHIRGCKWVPKDQRPEGKELDGCVWSGNDNEIKAVADKIVGSYRTMMKNAILTINAPKNIDVNIQHSSCPNPCTGIENCCDLSS